MAKGKSIPPTQGHLDIEEIRDDIVVLKNGAAAAVIQTTAVNFDLLSENEQDSMIFAFAALLNSLTFPLQILVRTQRVDVTNYLYRIAEAKRRANSQILISHIERYEKFIKDLVSKKQVLNKRFYVVVPYIGIDISQVTAGVTNLFRKNPPNVSQWTTLEKSKVNLEPKM